MEFLQSTYAAAADLAKWDRAALECELGEAGKCRGGVRKRVSQFFLQSFKGRDKSKENRRGGRGEAKADFGNPLARTASICERKKENHPVRAGFGDKILKHAGVGKEITNGSEHRAANDVF